MTTPSRDCMTTHVTGLAPNLGLNYLPIAPSIFIPEGCLVLQLALKSVLINSNALITHHGLLNRNYSNLVSYTLDYKKLIMKHALLDRGTYITALANAISISE